MMQHQSNKTVQVRPLAKAEVPLIISYFFTATPEFLRGMGADPDKLPNKTAWAQTLEKEIDLPLKEKKLFYLVWVQNGIPVGHSNLTFLEYGKEAHMHLHLWNPNARKKGLGLEFLNQCIPYYFECFKLKTLICEPYALNPAPNAILPQLGFTKTRTYRTTPGTINFEQEVNRWELNKESR